MSKRKLSSVPVAESPKISLKKEHSLKELRLYEKSYKGGGTQDFHYHVCQQVLQFSTKNNNEITSVFYPGCHRHLTPALIFPRTTFVDCDRKVRALYQDPCVDQYVVDHWNDKVATEPRAKVTFDFQDGNVQDPKFRLKQMQTFDLLISLSSGILAPHCTQFIRTGGYLLANDSHADARTIFVNNSEQWKLVAYHMGGNFTTVRLDECFRTKSSDRAYLTPKQVEESILVGSVSKRSFCMLMEPHFYLFERK